MKKCIQERGEGFRGTKTGKNPWAGADNTKAKYELEGPGMPKTPEDSKKATLAQDQARRNDDRRIRTTMMAKKTRLQEMALSILKESGEDLSALHKHVRDEYQGVAADLPRSGEGHHSAAHDHAADNLYDHFHKSHPHVNFRKVATHALKGWVDDDRKETRANEAKQKRREAAASKPPREKKSKMPEPWWKKAGYSTPMTKPRKGIGSH